MVDARVASYAIAGLLTFLTVLICIVAIHHARKNGASDRDIRTMFVGLAAFSVVIFLFWSFIAMFSIWFVINIMGVQ